VLAVHWLLTEVLGRKRYKRQHRRLREEWRLRSRSGDSGGSAEIRDLREKLLAGAEAARQALRPISPEATADVSRGEANALDLVAWLDQAEPLLMRGAETLALRHDVATAISKPMPDADRAPLEKLLQTGCAGARDQSSPFGRRVLRVGTRKRWHGRFQRGCVDSGQ
jgi:hypothetical protein